MHEPNGELVPVGGGDPIPLIRDQLIIGRRESCHVRLPFHNISGQHCELTYHNGYWYIRDLGSTNGIKVNGERVQKKALRPGDEIRIAKRKYVIQYQLQAGRRALDEILEEEDVMGQSLLEKAGLAKPRHDREEPTRHSFDPGNYLLEDEEDED